MTRETKIGLLVGLAFIIVVGILLSEHLTTSVERPAAQLADAGKTVREGVSAPGANSSLDAPPVRMAEPVVPTASVVPTAREIRPADTGASHVAIGGPSSQLPIVIDNRSNAPAGDEMVSPVVQNNDVPSSTEGPIVTRTPTDPFANDPLRQIARNSGEPLVPLDTNVNKPLQKSETTLAANNVREYQAQAGDTLSRIAALLPGGNTKTNRDAVVKLNPVLQKDPNKVVSGRKYLLPTEAGVSTPAPLPLPAPAPLVQQPTLVHKTTDPKPAAKTETASFRTYTVQKGDTLSKIAVEQLGSKAQMATILELNQAVLKNSDVIRVDMKLKLPVNN